MKKMYAISSYFCHPRLDRGSRAYRQISRVTLDPRLRGDDKLGVGRTLGFSLLEFAIVMIIAGLLAAGILVGQNMMRQAELRDMTSQFENYIATVETFRDKYDALPGDMYNAEDFWGSDTSCPNTTSNTVRKVETCNGDGNDRVDTDTEHFRLFQHLSNAEMITGMYTGVAGPNYSGEFVPGVNCPVIIRNTCLAIMHSNVPTTTASTFGYRPSHVIGFGYGEGSSDAAVKKGTITSEEAYLIDRKIDDGRPGTGDFQGRPDGAPSTPNCTTTTDSDTAEYDITNPYNACNILLYFTGS